MNKTPWRLIIDPPQNAAINMAVDEAIAIAFSEGKAPPTLRFYHWETPSFSIGTFQTLDQDWINALETQNIPIIRRITGGRGLLHDNELTYAIISSTQDPRFSKGIKGTFYTIAQGFLKGLHPFGLEGIDVSPSRLPPLKQKNPLCFDAVSMYEITAKGKKLLGSAQRRWKSHFLQHGSLIYQHSSMILKIHHASGASLISKNQTALADLLPHLPPDDTLIQSLKQGFESALEIELTPGGLSLYEKKISDRLVKEKYGNTDWTRNRQRPDAPSRQSRMHQG